MGAGNGGGQFLAPLVRLIADRAADPARHRTKICVLLGAGADISSGGLSFAELKRQTVEEFAKTPLFDVTSAEAIDTRFEDFFRALRPDDRALLVEAAFRRLDPLEPSDAYKLLVLLAEAGGVDAVVTTNFDLMLERAQNQLGRDLFQVFAPGLARPYLISHGRFDLPRKPYLKLHGDISSRSVTVLTTEDLTASTYDASMIELLTSILCTHDLILAGYSGYDTALSQIIADAVGASSNHVFWCNPRAPAEGAPLYGRIAPRTRVVPIGFDALLMEIARPVLERPSLAPTEPTYVRCLFDWRVDYCNREYVHAYGERAGRSLVDTFARRRVIEDRLAAFLRPNHPLAIIAGPSGFGKTTIGIRLYKTWRNDNLTKIMLVRSRSLPESGDIEQHVCEQLGGLGSRTPFSLFKLERWLRDQGVRLILFIDAINEFSPNLGRCVQLFRNILRFCYFLPEVDSALRVVTTIRQETWNAMLPHLDVAQLRKTLWAEGESQTFNTIACGPFTDEERDEAIGRLRDQGYASIETERLTPSAENQLRDPYLLGMLAEAGHRGLPPVPNAALYQRVFDAKLQQRGSFVDTATLKDILASLALKCMESPQERFREIDVQPASLRGEVLRLVKDLHVIVDAGDGFLRFDHDRTFEYFLALALASNSPPSLETIDDLREFLKRFRTQSKPIAAARLYFQLAPRDRFAIISAALRLLDNRDGRYSLADRELLFGFAREVLMEMTEQEEPLARQYLSDAITAARSGSIGEHHLRTVVQAAASLPVGDAVPLLTRAANGTSSLAQTEATIYAVDKLAKRFLSDRCPTIDLLVDAPYSAFFADPSIPTWRRLGRVLSFSAQIGPDNAHPDEYASTLRCLQTGLDRVLREHVWSDQDSTALCDMFLENCDRLLFNATPHGIKRFFGNPRRAEFAPIVDRLAAGEVLREEDLRALEPYTQSLSADLEYHLSHVMFILSSLNDLDATLWLAESRFKQFSNNTPPEEIDFFEAVLVYLHVLHGRPYDAERFGPWEETILTQWPDILMYRPGLERGERRGFQDLFDRVFEDGFGVIYPYGVLLPSLRRQRMRYDEYRHEAVSDSAPPLPLYARHLEHFLSGERIEEALQILQALSGVIVDWPAEGLLSLRGVIGHPDPRIRRATIRILAEAYNRHPAETMQFLRTSGAAVSDEDMLEIKIRQDARIGRRQVSEEEWARIGRFLMSRPGARPVFIQCVRALLKADSPYDAVQSVVAALGLAEGAAR